MRRTFAPHRYNTALVAGADLVAGATLYPSRPTLALLLLAAALAAGAFLALERTARP